MASLSSICSIPPHHYFVFSPSTSTPFPHLFLLKIKHKSHLNNIKISKKNYYINNHYALLQDPEKDRQNVPNLHCGISSNTWWTELRGAFGQRFNPEGILCASKVLTKDPHLLLPHVTVPNIRYVNWDYLHTQGFKGVVFDKDNTLTIPYSLSLYDPLTRSLRRCKEVFGEKNVAILSNSAGLDEFDPAERKAKALERRIGLKVIRHRVKKPAGDAEEVEKQLGCRPEEIVMVGDRRFTDVVYGNRNGFLTVFTEPLSGKGEPFVVKVVRKVEDYLLRKYYSKGLKPASHCLLPDCEVHLVCLNEPL